MIVFWVRVVEKIVVGHRREKPHINLDRGYI